MAVARNGFRDYNFYPHSHIHLYIPRAQTMQFGYITEKLATSGYQDSYIPSSNACCIPLNEPCPISNTPITTNNPRNASEPLPHTPSAIPSNLHAPLSSYSLLNSTLPKRQPHASSMYNPCWRVDSCTQKMSRSTFCANVRSKGEADEV